MIFGVAGIPANYKGKFDKIFDWLRQMKLNAFEIQCTYGFKISEQNKAIFNRERENGFNLSIHAPYYINMGSLNQDVVARSKSNMKQGIELSKEIGYVSVISNSTNKFDYCSNGYSIRIPRSIRFNHNNVSRSLI